MFPIWEHKLRAILGNIVSVNGPFMKMVGREHLEKFRGSHSHIRSQLDAWVCEVEDAQWQSPQDIQKRFPHASFLTKNRVIFNLKGNKYRLEAKVSFKNQVVLIKRIGTHAEYSRWKL